MTRFALDAQAFVALARIGIQPAGHQLVGPAALRSEAMSIVYRDYRAGRLKEAELRPLLERITTLKARLLGDRVSRAVAWQIATDLGLPDTRQAEYLAVAKLQADALVALDPEIATLAEGIVPLAELGDLSR